MIEQQTPGRLISDVREVSDPRSTNGADASVVDVAAGRWVLDPGRSSATFTVSNFGVKVVHGSVPITSAVADVSTDAQLSSVSAVLALSDVATGNARRDLDLAKPHLLDTARYPTMSFSGAGTDSRVTGVLLVRGVPVPIGLQTVVTADAAGRVTVTATTSFDRSALGMKVPRILVGRWVEIAITAVFSREETG